VPRAGDEESEGIMQWILLILVYQAEIGLTGLEIRE
jgi:hypothetical protein